jgi:Ca2+/Na+ antiporter
MSERLAGSTILALGSSIPMIASNMNAVLLDNMHEVSLALTGVLGSSIFQMTVGLAIACFVMKKKYSFSYNVFIKDLTIYIATLLLLFYYVLSKNIDLMKVNRSNYIYFIFIIIEFSFSFTMDCLHDLSDIIIYKCK